MIEKWQQREYTVISYLVKALAELGVPPAPPIMIIDALIGILWDEEEADYLIAEMKD